MTANRASIVTPRMIAALLIVSVLSLLAYMVLSAYAPELRSDQTSDANVLSKSAVGYAGLQILAEGMGTDVQASRIPLPCVHCSLTILTPEFADDPHDVMKLVRPEPRLIVLPKWVTSPFPGHRGWVQKYFAISPELLSKPISLLLKKPVVAQAQKAKPFVLHATDKTFANDVPSGTMTVEDFQTIAAQDLEPVLADSHNRTVLGRVRGTQTYILSDPDLVNNFGLHDRAKAYFSMSLIQKLRAGSGPVVFDLTLDGFRRAPNLLRSVFSPPFLGATFCAIMTAVLLIFHTLNRFGSPVQTGRAIAFGKRALADNTAAVIKLLRRETDMAPRYAEAMFSLVALQTGTSRAQMTEDAGAHTIENRAGAQMRFSELHTEAQRVRDKTDLLRVAEKIYRWRQKVLHERH